MYKSVQYVAKLRTIDVRKPKVVHIAKEFYGRRAASITRNTKSKCYQAGKSAGKEYG